MTTHSDQSSEDRYQNSGFLEETDAWPGVAPPAGWFLHTSSDGDLGDSPISWYQDPDDPEAGAESPAPATEEPALPASQAYPPQGSAPEQPVGARPDGRPAEPVVGATRALNGRAGGPGFQPLPPGTGPRRALADASPWQTSQRLWRQSDIQWQPSPPPSQPALSQPALSQPALSQPALSQPALSQPALSQPAPPRFPVPLGAPVFAVADIGLEADSQAPEHEIRPDEESWQPLGHPAPLWHRAYDEIPPLSADAPATEYDTLLLEPEPPGVQRPTRRLGRPSRRTAAIAAPAAVLVTVAVLALALLTGHGPKLGQLTGDHRSGQQPNPGAAAQGPLTIGVYPGQKQRGAFQAIGRIVSSGNTIVAIGSQVSDGLTRQQFFVSANGGASWRLAPVRTPSGAPPPLGYPAARVAGGPGGWLAEGPQSIWTSPDGRSWTLAATHGITPLLPHDAILVLTKTASGFLAAGQAAAPGGGSQGVIWISRDGLNWQRLTAAQLGLAGPGESVQGIAYATWRGPDTLISGQVTKDGTAYSAVWLSTDGGSAWTRVTVPADHGAASTISGLGSDASGLIAVRPGRSASGAAEGVAYFSPNGSSWQYSAAIGAAGGWSPSVVKGSDYGFVVSGTSAAGQVVAYVSTGSGTAWRPTGSLGAAAGESVTGVTLGPAGTVVAVGSTSGNTVSQQPVFLEADPAGSVRPVPLTGIPGATVPELAVNGLATAGGEQVAVGGADGYPAVWRKASGGSWSLVSSLSQVSASQSLTALTGVTHGPAGWLAVGLPGPVVLTSANGTTWHSAAGPGSIAAALGNVSLIAATAGPAGYVIVGRLKVNGACVADVWWSQDLTSWTRAHDVNDVSGSSQVLAVAADADGFVSVGAHNGHPAVWTTTDGRSWTTIVLPQPAGASSAILQQIAISGNRVAALGQENTQAGTVPFAELSVDGGATWHQVPFSSPGPDTAFTALTAGPGGFVAAGQFGLPGQRQVAVWTSANGTVWASSQVSGLTGAQAGGSYQLTALAPSGPPESAVTGIGSIATQQAQEVFTAAMPAR